MGLFHVAFAILCEKEVLVTGLCKPPSTVLTIVQHLLQAVIARQDTSSYRSPRVPYVVCKSKSMSNPR